MEKETRPPIHISGYATAFSRRIVGSDWKPDRATERRFSRDVQCRMKILQTEMAYVRGWAGLDDLTPAVLLNWYSSIVLVVLPMFFSALPEHCTERKA